MTCHPIHYCWIKTPHSIWQIPEVGVGARANTIIDIFSLKLATYGVVKYEVARSQCPASGIDRRNLESKP